MSICPYCQHDAGIDEDLGICKFCGAPRLDCDSIELLDEEEIKTHYPIETGVTEITDEQRQEFYKKSIESDTEKKLEMIKPCSYPKIRKKSGLSQKQFFGVLLGAIVMMSFLLQMGGPIGVSAGSAWITFIGHDELTIDNLDAISMEIFVLEENKWKLSEICTFHNGVAESIDDYINGEQLVLHIIGTNDYCDVYKSMVLELSSDEIYYNEAVRSIDTMKIATDFTLGIQSIEGAVINENFTHDVREPLMFTILGQNLVDNTGFISTNSLYGENWKAYIFVEINQQISLIPSGDAYEFISVSQEKSILIFGVTDDTITRDSSQAKSGIFDICTSIKFDTKKDTTIKYGLILNGDINCFIDVQVWNYGARIYQESTMFQVN